MAAVDRAPGRRQAGPGALQPPAHRTWDTLDVVNKTDPEPQQRAEPHAEASTERRHDRKLDYRTATLRAMASPPMSVLLTRRPMQDK